MYYILFYFIILYYIIKINNIILFYIIFLNMILYYIILYFLVLVNIYIFIDLYLHYQYHDNSELCNCSLLIYCYYFIKNAYMTFKVQFCWIWSGLHMSCPTKISGLLYMLLFFFCHATEISLELSTHTSCYATVSSLELSIHASC